MMRKVLVALTVVWAMALGGMPTAAWADPTLDQSFTAPQDLAGVINECCAYVGQTFTAGRSGVLSGVTIDVAERDGGTPYPLNVTIRAVDSTTGLPRSTVLAEVLLDSGHSALADLISFPQPPEVTTGKQYAIVVNYPGAPPAGVVGGSGQGSWAGANGDQYPAGREVVLRADGSWFDFDGGHDLHFTTYVDSASRLGPEQRLTKNSTSEDWPELSGYRLVYSDYRNGHRVAVDEVKEEWVFDTRIRDLRTGKDRLLSIKHLATGRAAISGNRVVWNYYRKGRTDAIIYHNLKAGTHKRVRVAGGRNLEISGSSQTRVWRGCDRQRRVGAGLGVEVFR